MSRNQGNHQPLKGTASVNMETSTKRCLKSAAFEQMSNVLIKQEMEWLAEDTHTPDLANQQVELAMEPIRSIKTEEDSYRTAEAAHAVQDFTPLPQTDEFIKAELILDEEFRDKMSDSAENCKQLVQPLADRKEEFLCDLCQRTFSTKSNLSRHKKVHYDKHLVGFKASTFICEVCDSSYSSKRNLREHMLKKHLSKVQSNTALAQTADDPTNTHTEGSFGEQAASLGQEGVAQGNESKPDTKSEACEVCHCIFPTEYIRIHMRLAHSKQKCELCSRTFKWKCHLQRHLNTHASNRKREFVCDICERDFYEKCDLDKHQKRYAQKDHPKFECEVCGSTFKRKGQLDLHLSTKHLDQSLPFTPALETGEDEKREFPCDLCERKFPSKSVLKRHEKIHTTLKRPNFICEVCGSSFTRKADQKIHMLRKHLDRVQSKTSGPQTVDGVSMGAHTKEFSDTETAAYGQASQDSAALRSKSESDTKSEACEVCDCIFPTEYIRIHMRLAHKKVHNQNKFNCKVCGKRFKQKESLKVHMLRRQHFDETQQFTPQSSNDADVPMKTALTSDEGEEFIDEENERGLTSHAEAIGQTALVADDEQRAKVSVAEDSASCEVCHNSYPADLIETHMRISHGDRTYKCQFCPLICLRKAQLQRHIRIHDGKAKRTGPYACEQCGLKFHSELRVKLHMIRKHNKNRLPEFNCGLCEKKFYSKKGCEQHKRTHTDDAISCGVCGARFTHEKSLKYHMLHIHTDKSKQFTPDPPAGKHDSVHTKEELISDEEFLAEET